MLVIQMSQSYKESSKLIKPKRVQHLFYGIDLDGVLFNFLDPFNDWLSKHLGVEIHANGITDYSWWKCIDGLTEEEFWAEFDRFGKSGAYGKMELIPGAKQGLNALSQVFDIAFITARPDYAYDDTVMALKKHFGFGADRLFMARNCNKSYFVNELGINFFIEDAPHHAIDIVEKSTARVDLMNTPYNQDVNHPKIKRVSSWDEILKNWSLNVAVRDFR